ncbi:MAG: hypothetical protein KDH18_04525, partial [Rhodoferax sp.]|nr:hypothetical protein [Rhodoferax sp.]
MNRLSQHRATGRNALVLALVLVGSLWVGPVQAALFEDTEARTAILEARKRIEANRIATDAAIQRLVESHNELLRRSTEENMQLRRSLLDLQNQIESLRTELARSNG